MLKKALANFVKIEHTLFPCPCSLRGPFAEPALDRLGPTSLGPVWGSDFAGGSRRAHRGPGFEPPFGRPDWTPCNPRTANRGAAHRRPAPCVNRPGYIILVRAPVIYLLAACTPGRPGCSSGALAPAPAGLYHLSPDEALHLGLPLWRGPGPGPGPHWAAPSATTSIWPQTRGPLWWLAAFAFFWVSGFDVLYALLDEDFRPLRQGGLCYSVPQPLRRRHGPGPGADAARRRPALPGRPGLPTSLAPHGSAPIAWAADGARPAGCCSCWSRSFGYSLEMGSPFFKINAWIGVAVGLAVGVGVILP